MSKSPSQSPSQPSKPAVSARKAAANRENARRSTGPRTPEGKARSSLNALRHGILARAAFNVTLEGEARRSEFERIVAGLAQEFQPQSLSEQMAVQHLAGCYWRLAKVLTYETEAAWRTNRAGEVPWDERKPFDDQWMFQDLALLAARQRAVFPIAGLGAPTIPGGIAARTVMRYEAAVNSAMHKCLAFLERRRKERAALGDEEPEELDYVAAAAENAAQAPPAPSQPASGAAEQQPAAPASAPQSTTATAEPTVGSTGQSAATPELHERSQKDEGNPTVSPRAERAAAQQIAKLAANLAKMPPEKS